MALNAGLACLLLILPTIQAYRSDPNHLYPSDGAENHRECELDLQVLSSSEIRGVFDSENSLEITFRAILVDDVIYSATTVVNASDPNAVLRVQLSFPNVEGRMVPEIEKHILESAEQLIESTTCEIADHLNEVFEELADRLYRCTERMGMSQLRFSIMYHETIVASAKRICKGAETVCTASPKYIYGNGLFICQEDMEELFPELMEEARRKMEEAQKPKTDVLDMNEERDKRWSAWCLLTRPHCGGLEGGDWGCCGNYDGCCSICHSLCLGHDAICTCCLGDHWFCGPDCQPDSWC